MRRKEELENIKDFIDSSYNSYMSSLIVDTEGKFSQDSPLGYCFKYVDQGKDKKVTYKIVCSKIGIPRTDFRVLMHEYGHIYLAHLDGIHEDLDTQICNTIRDHREELVERINKECGIDFADALLKRVIDDPNLNHSLHNIAMDMEVNSKILSTEDVEEMEADITSVMPKYEEEYLKWAADHTDDPDAKKEIEDALKKMQNESKVKLILPCRYEFEDGLTYPEYIIMIIKNLDKFIKMMVSISLGGNGDTSQVSSEDVKNALGGGGSGQGEGQESDQQGDPSGSSSASKGMKSLSDLMEQMGMKDKDGDGDKGKDGKGSEKDGKGKGDGGDGYSECPYKGTRDKGDSSSSSQRDHRTDSRDEADRKRKLGQIKSGGGLGCGSSGGPDATRMVDKTVDEVDMAIDEVIMNFSKKIVKIDQKKDMLYKYNRGINRTVISPTIRRKVTISTDPSICYLIDISGSMETELVDRVLKSISKNMQKLGTGRGLKYNIITWSTRLGEHIKNIDPRKPVPRISTGGGTSMAEGIKYFKENYSDDTILILISDFEDYLEEWSKITEKMTGYTLYGFNYGYRKYKTGEIKNMIVKNFDV